MLISLFLLFTAMTNPIRITAIIISILLLHNKVTSGVREEGTAASRQEDMHLVHNLSTTEHGNLTSTATHRTDLTSTSRGAVVCISSPSILRYMRFPSADFVTCRCTHSNDIIITLRNHYLYVDCSHSLL